MFLFVLVFYHVTAQMESINWTELNWIEIIEFGLTPLFRFVEQLVNKSTASRSIVEFTPNNACRQWQAIRTALKHHWASLRVERKLVKRHWTRQRRRHPQHNRPTNRCTIISVAKFLLNCGRKFETGTQYRRSGDESLSAGSRGRAPAEGGRESCWKHA